MERGYVMDERSRIIVGAIGYLAGLRTTSPANMRQEGRDMQRFVMLWRCFGLMCCAALLVACSTTRDTAWETAGPSEVVDESVQGRAADLLKQANMAWDLRSDPEQARAAIDSLKTATEIDPTNAEALVDLSHALYFYADCHLREDESNLELYKNTHEEGVTYAEKALAVMSPDFAGAMAKGAPIHEEPTVRDDADARHGAAPYWQTRTKNALDLLDASAVPALYWRAANLGRWASTEGFATILEHKDEVRATMEFCLANDPTYWYQGPDRYFGVFYARLTRAFSGGDMTRSAGHFNRSLEAEPEYLSTRILMAEEWAVKDGDRELYEELTESVLAADPNANPSIKPENECEQRKAKMLRAQIDQFFPTKSKSRASSSKVKNRRSGDL